MKVDYSGMAENLGSDLEKVLEQNKGTLKPCPFCGGEAKLNVHRFWCERTGKFEDGGYSVQCSENECIAKAKFFSIKTEAIDAWNTRTPVDKVIERLEDNSFWTEATFDEDGYCNDDSEKVIDLGVAIKIIKQEMM